MSSRRVTSKRKVQGSFILVFVARRVLSLLTAVTLLAATAWAQGNTTADPVELWSSEVMRVADNKAAQADRAVYIVERLQERGPAVNNTEYQSLLPKISEWPQPYWEPLYKAAQAAGLFQEPQASQPEAATRDQGPALARMRRFAPLIVPVLREHGLPDSLLAVALIESGFNPMARSPKGAVGIWQLMPATARRFGLNPNGPFDERLDPGRSTHAAARYLEELHELWGDWNLALASYNAGEGRVQEAIVRGGTKDFESLAARRLLPEETIQYVPAVARASASMSRQVIGESTYKVRRMPGQSGFRVPEPAAPEEY
ncbi:MAG: lytic transglycosylase domain-containing protein [Terriglobales bacterium]